MLARIRQLLKHCGVSYSDLPLGSADHSANLTHYGDVAQTGNSVQVGDTTRTGASALTGALTQVGAVDLNPVGGYNLQEGIPSRFRLVWVAGQEGKPGLNADITPASADDANDGATKAELDTMNATDRNLELQGTSAASSDCAYNAEGGIVLTTAGADGDEMILVPHANTAMSPWANVTWGTDQSVRWEGLIKTGSAAQIGNCIIWAGLKLTSAEVESTDADQVWFRYENGVNAGKWQAISSNTNVDDVHDTGVVVAAATEYHLVIEIDASRVAKFYINGTLVETTAALKDATDLIPYIAVAADGAAEAKILKVRGQTISRAYA